MDIKTLNEGIIKVPPEILNNSMEVLKGMVTAIVINELPLLYIIKDLSDESPDLYANLSDEKIKKYTLKNEMAFVKVSYNESSIQYANSNEDNSFYFGIMDRDGTTKALYNNKYDVVFVNVSNLINSLQNTFNIFFDTEILHSNDQEFVRKTLKTTQADKTINGKIRAFLNEAKGSVEHELAHMIQFKYLKEKSPEQVSVNKNYDSDNSEYFNSSVEFSPQIISSINSMESIYNIAEDNMDNTKELMKTVFDLITFVKLDKEKLQELMMEVENKRERNRLKDAIQELAYGTRPFYKHLKEKSDKRWKIAVKYLYSELYKKGIL